MTAIGHTAGRRHRCLWKSRQQCVSCTYNMCVCAFTHTHARMHARPPPPPPTHTHACTPPPPPTHTHMHASTHTHATHTNTHTNTHTRTHTHTHTHTHTCIRHVTMQSCMSMLYNICMITNKAQSLCKCTGNCDLFTMGKLRCVLPSVHHAVTYTPCQKSNETMALWCETHFRTELKFRYPQCRDCFSSARANQTRTGVLVHEIVDLSAVIRGVLPSSYAMKAVCHAAHRHIITAASSWLWTLRVINTKSCSMLPLKERFQYTTIMVFAESLYFKTYHKLDKDLASTSCRRVPEYLLYRT